MALHKLRGRVQFNHLMAWATLFGYLISFLDTRAAATGTIAFMRMKLSPEMVGLLAIAFAISVLWLYFSKPNPIGLAICAIPQLVYLTMGTWWFLETRSSAAAAPITAFGIHFGFSILCFGYYLYSLWGVLTDEHPRTD